MTPRFTKVTRYPLTLRRVPAMVMATLLLVSVPVAGQTPQAERPGSVRVLVHDATDLPIVGAAVVLTAPDGSTLHGKTDTRGEATFNGVQPGVYSGRVESVGFNPFNIEQISIRGGASVIQEITLEVAGVKEALVVTAPADDQQTRDSLTSQLTSEQLAALPEDPEELAQVLRHLVGADADIRVNGFSGGPLPPGTQIQDIRIRYDRGAASAGGGPRVEIRTTPGGDRWRTNGGITAQDQAWNSRDAFSSQRPRGQTRQYSGTLNGPVVRGRTGVSVSVDRSETSDNQMIRAATPAGLYSNLIERPSDRIGVWTRVEHRLTRAQAIRVDVGGRVDEAQNQGIGEFDLPERGFTSKESVFEVQVGHHTTGRRYENDFRFSLVSGDSELSSVSGARTIRVLDAFTSGGAQQLGGHRSQSFELEHELQFTAGGHQLTAGSFINGSYYRGDQHSNASGTYTFASLASFEAGEPTTFTQRVGDPTYQYSMHRFGWYAQDDYRVRRNLVINLGVRHDFQTQLNDWANFAPRIGASWTPSRKARTTLRASMGVVNSPMNGATYQQTLLVNGLRQWDLVISSPGYPDPFSAGVTQAAAPPSIIRARSDLEMPSRRRYTVGVDQPIGKFLRFRGTASRETGDNAFRSRNANAPVNGVRPDPSVLNITELESTARSLNESVQTELSVNYPPRRLSANVTYVFGRALDEADGAFSLPPDSFDLTGEWGPARTDARHRVNAGLNTDLPGQFRLAANFRALSAMPYNITTGTDANGDGVHNERPAGVTRNSGRGAATKYLDLTLTWRLSLGQRQPVNAAGDASQSGRVPQPAAPGLPPAAARENYVFRIEVFARATNVFNVVNLQNFSGVLTSPFFGMPTSAGPARRVLLGTRLWF
jgi:hypothetical protein